ncbi:Ap4A phosphorylase II [Synechococcus moorigangaii CMS01]|nr:Ap4A phosphorylase II [Synechococcus moorigangaii CMS01]
MNELLAQIQRTTKQAKQVGALHSLTTAQEIIVDHGIPFVVRILEQLERKENYQAKQAKAKINPFLPYDEDLFVCDLTPNHVCLLNKFNVVDHHILIITRDFQPQETWLTAGDFAALAHCLQRLDGLAFYNAGAIAGASQPHKHLQLIPFQSAGERFSVPLDQALQHLPTTDQPQQLSLFPFAHGIIALPETYDGQILFEAYVALLRFLKFIAGPIQPGPQTKAYNLLVTRRWMLLVQRIQDQYEKIPVNSLGFAGALLVRNRGQLDFLKTLTPLQLLEKVAARGD